MQSPAPQGPLNSFYGLIKSGCMSFMNEQREVLTDESAEVGGPDVGHGQCP